MAIHCKCAGGMLEQYAYHRGPTHPVRVGYAQLTDSSSDATVRTLKQSYIATVNVSDRTEYASVHAHH